MLDGSWLMAHGSWPRGDRPDRAGLGPGIRRTCLFLLISCLSVSRKLFGLPPMNMTHEETQVHTQEISSISRFASWVCWILDLPKTESNRPQKHGKTIRQLWDSSCFLFLYIYIFNEF